MVDEGRALISEWDAKTCAPGPQRNFESVMENEGDVDRAVYTAITGHGSGQWGGGDGPMQTLCEPLRQVGVVVGVVMCTKQMEGGKGGFTMLDEILLQFLCQHSGFLFHRIMVFNDALLTSQRTLKITALSRHNTNYNDEEVMSAAPTTQQSDVLSQYCTLLRTQVLFHDAIRRNHPSSISTRSVFIFRLGTCPALKPRLDIQVFALASVQLRPCKDLLQAGGFVLYAAVPGGGSGGRSKSLWTICNNGLGTRKTISYGDGIAGFVPPLTFCHAGGRERQTKHQLG